MTTPNCNQQFDDLTLAVLSVKNKIPVEFEVSSNGLKTVLTMKEIKNISHVLPIIRSKKDMVNTLNLSNQYFNLIRQYTGQADWISFSNYVKSVELSHQIKFIVLEYIYVYSSTVNLQLIHTNKKCL